MSKFAIAAVLLAASPVLTQAQRLPPRPVSAAAASTAILDAGLAPRASRFAPQDTATRPAALRPLRVAKWSVLTVATGAGIYGFLQNDEADDRFRRLEQLCQDQQFRCAQRTASGEYADPEFEALYQEVRRRDDRSHMALLFSQVGLAASVALFLIDLGNSDSPGDIPWVPGRLDAGSRNGRVELALRLDLPG